MEEKNIKRGNINWKNTMLVFLALIGAGLLIKTGVSGYGFVSRTVKEKDEIMFAYDHPELIRPIRDVYKRSHDLTDENIREILSGK